MEVVTGQQGGSEEFAAALRDAIARRGLPLDRIRFHLSKRGHDLSIATLSYWQSGRSKPDRATSLAALGCLEEILGVPRGNLAALLPPRRSRRQTQRDEVTRDRFHDGVGLEVEELSNQLGLNWNDGLQRVSVHDTLHIRPDRTEGTHIVRELIRAERDGADRFPFYFGLTDPDAYPFISGLRNCHVGQLLEHPTVPLIVAEIMLEQPLWTGQPLLIEYELGGAGLTLPSDGWERACLRRTRDVSLEIVFDPQDLPSEVLLRQVVDGTETNRPYELHGGRLHHLLLDFGPGICGADWFWADAEPRDCGSHGSRVAAAQAGSGRRTPRS